MISQSTPSLPRRYMWMLWLFASALGVLLSLHGLSAALIDGVFIPADHDSFYHARRMLAALPAPWRLLQFDPRIHAPEGSWVTWPWAYDMLVTLLAKTVLAVLPIS